MSKKRVLLKVNASDRLPCQIDPQCISGLQKGESTIQGFRTCPVPSIFVSRTVFIHLLEVGDGVQGNFIRLFITSPKTKPASEMLGIKLEFSIVSQFVTQAQGSI